MWHVIWHLLNTLIPVTSSCIANHDIIVNCVIVNVTWICLANHDYGIATLLGKNAIEIVCVQCSVLTFLWCSSLDCHDGHIWWTASSARNIAFELYHISHVANYNSHFKCSKLQFKCSKCQFTFQLSPFTKYGHNGSLMNHTTGMSKHCIVHVQSQ